MFFIKYLQINREIACILTFQDWVYWVLPWVQHLRLNSVLCSLLILLHSGLSLNVSQKLRGWLLEWVKALELWCITLYDVDGNPIQIQHDLHLLSGCAHSRWISSFGENGWMNMQIGMSVEALQMLPDGNLLEKSSLKHSLYADWRSGTKQIEFAVGPVVIVINRAIRFDEMLPQETLNVPPAVAYLSFSSRNSGGEVN